MLIIICIGISPKVPIKVGLKFVLNSHQWLSKNGFNKYEAILPYLAGSAVQVQKHKCFRTHPTHIPSTTLKFGNCIKNLLPFFELCVWHKSYLSQRRCPLPTPQPQLVKNRIKQSKAPRSIKASIQPVKTLFGPHLHLGLAAQGLKDLSSMCIKYVATKNLMRNL